MDAKGMMDMKEMMEMSARWPFLNVVSLQDKVPDGEKGALSVERDEEKIILEKIELLDHKGR